MNCLFCEPHKLNFISKNDHVFSVRDQFPVTAGHLLIIPKAHKVDFFALNEKEREAAFEMINDLKDMSLQDDPSITGFNIGMNCGKDAGQTIFHCHIHLIPRRKGDCDSPKGGVRGVIPEKQSY